MLESLKLPKIVTKRKKRLGRGTGSGAGAKSGRGTTRHQAAREKIALGFEGGQNPVMRKFGYLRGKTKNKPLFTQQLGIRVGRLNGLTPNSKVDLEALVKRELIKASDVAKGVKIIAGGELKVALEIALPTTESAKKVIEKAGGKVV